ncbi:MAG: hypothetical protein NTX56_07555 [Proteobacteria bacterium]|nr:hypothetical protein [Pseudomonadota bacterium]
MTQESDYISFQIAKTMLADSLSATAEEVAMWAWLGPSCGGLAPFADNVPPGFRQAEIGSKSEIPHHAFDAAINEDELSPPLLYPPDPSEVGINDTWATWLTNAYFQKTEIDEFDPTTAGRFISWSALAKRWQERGLSENESWDKVCGKIRNDELMDMAPIFGGTELDKEAGAPKNWVMFPLEQIEAIEAQDFPNCTEEPYVSTVITHTLRNKRKHALAAVIATVKNSAVDSTDYQSVWAALVTLAESSNRPSPLIGFVDGEGVKYQGENEVKFFTKNALRNMMNRAKSVH